jgi:hypothetical protein
MPFFVRDFIFFINLNFSIIIILHAKYRMKIYFVKLFFSTFSSLRLLTSLVSQVRDDAIKTILKQSRNRHSVPCSRRKRAGSRCVSMRACISSPQRSPQNATEANCDSTAVSTSMKRKTFPDYSQPITVDKISIAAIKEMGIEITCDSVDDQDISDINNDRNESIEQNCICGGFSFLSRRKFT